MGGFLGSPEMQAVIQSLAALLVAVLAGLLGQVLKALEARFRSQVQETQFFSLTAAAAEFVTAVEQEVRAGRVENTGEAKKAAAMALLSAFVAAGKYQISEELLSALVEAAVKQQRTAPGV